MMSGIIVLMGVSVLAMIVDVAILALTELDHMKP